MIELEHFLVTEDSALKKALANIEKNKHGIIFATNGKDEITGIATDGDIRRKLIQDGNVNQPVSECLNRDFKWAKEGSSRESLLKYLDHQIRVIPLLNEKMQLVDVVSRYHLPVQKEEKTYARARSPVRISFGGGGSDLTHFFSTDLGAVINTTISLYSHATLRKRADRRVIVHSKDLDETLDAVNIDEAVKGFGSFRLVQAILKTVQPDYGFELYLNSDFPLGSGLGGSAVVSAAILGCFNEFRQDKWDDYELAELAYQAERIYLGIAGGWQDQYATVFGGFNFIEFKMEQNVIHPLRINPSVLLELEESLIICDTGLGHDSGMIHDNQRKMMSQDKVKELVKKNVTLTYEIRNQLLRGRLMKFGELLNEAWKLKRQFSSRISNKQIDHIYKTALKNGASGGKLMGAGGGGFFLFHVSPFKKFGVIKSLETMGLQIRQFRFDQEGLKSWSQRDNNSVK